jgi:hypothetical protein
MNAGAMRMVKLLSDFAVEGSPAELTTRTAPPGRAYSNPATVSEPALAHALGLKRSA